MPGAGRYRKAGGRKDNGERPHRRPQHRGNKVAWGRLDTDLQFRAHKSLSLEKARMVEDRVRWLRSTKAFEPGLIRRVQMAAVQVVALYGAEL